MRSTFLVALLGYASAQSYTLGKGAALPAKSDPVYSCAAGFTLNGKTCEKTVTAAPQVVCHQGQLQGLECVIQTAKTARCPPGSVPEGKSCAATSQTAATPFCPNGFTEGFGDCELTEQLPLIEVCEVGSREGPQCVVTQVAQYQQQKFCPAGFEEHAKGGCWKTEQYNCSPLNQGKGGSALRGLIGKEGGVGLGLAGRGSSGPAQNVKVHVISQTCERKEAAPYVVEKSCPAGMTDIGTGCVLKNYFPTTQRCSNGGPIEACFTTRKAPLQHTCAPGAQLQGQACITRTAVQEESFCATGYDNGNACVQTFAPAQVCQSGLQLSGGLCVGVQTAQPIVTRTISCLGKNCA